jgi:hypothetical protein
LAETCDEPSQFQQVLDAEGRTPGRDHDERIGWRGRGPVGRERGEPAFIVMEVDAWFAPVLTVRHQGELAAVEGVKWVRDPERLACTVPIGCI